MSSRADAVVVFGATGDLAKKMIFPALYRLHRSRRLEVPVVGIARSDWDSEQLRCFARESVEASEDAVDENGLSGFLPGLSYISGDYRAEDTFERLRHRLEGRSLPLFYLAIPPFLFEDVVAHLGRVGLNRGGRLVVEKPFGRDLESAHKLNRCLGKTFSEDSVFRIDHFLGKESVQNLMLFRFANTILEPVWNRRYVQSIQVTMAESFGVDGRGSFYDGVGALRDVVQNHLLQVIAHLAMEPPVGPSADDLRDERVKVLRAMRPLSPSKVVRGQFRGYRDEKGVDPESETETFVGLRTYVDSWRWAGVPFLVRAGKELPVTATEAVVEFHAPPSLLFCSPEDTSPHPNHFRMRLGRDDGIALSLEVKRPGEGMCTKPVDFDVSFEEVLGPRAQPYERLLLDAAEGDQALFARQDGVEEAWRIIQPVLDDPGAVIEYDPGSWGPSEADDLIRDVGRWHVPDGSSRDNGS